MMVNALKNHMPPLPAFAARFRAIYFEPIMGSGERLTVGIMIKADNGEFTVFQTLSNKVMRSMYGDHAHKISNLVHMILAHARAHLSGGLDLEQWEPPLVGVYLTDVKTTYSNNALQGVLFQAITHYSSLCREKWIDETLLAINANELEEAIDDDVSSFTLIKQIKDYLADSPQYQNCWRQEVVVSAQASITIDYLGSAYNANFSNFDTKQIKPALNQAKAKLFDLNVLRENRQRSPLSDHQRFELLVVMRSHPTPETQDNFYALTELARTIDLSVYAKSSAKELANRIVERERLAA